MRRLTSDDFHELYRTFKSAFSSHSVKIQPSEEEFSRRIYKKIHIDHSISAGYFDGDIMVGFILHASNIYEGIPTAYNGGTGVLPGFRNQRIAEQLYEFLLPEIRAKFLARILLEVVEVNEYAIKLYEKIGFNFKRRFLCYRQTIPLKLKNPLPIREGKMGLVDFDFMDFESSFLDSQQHLKLGNERVLIAEIEGKKRGYIIFQPHVGRISQLAVSRLYRGRAIGKSLIYAAQQQADKTLTIMNIPEDQDGFDQFLKSSGFQNQINQFEMELII